MFTFSGALYKGDINPNAIHDINELQLNLLHLTSCFILLIAGCAICLLVFFIEVVFANISTASSKLTIDVRKKTRFFYLAGLTVLGAALAVALANAMSVDTLNDTDYVSFAVASPMPFIFSDHLRVFAIKENADFFYRCYRTTESMLL